MGERGAVENMVGGRLPSPTFWQDQRVFLTGHTGFKGGWAALWLTAMGAQVCGYALEPETDPSLHEALGLEGRVRSHIGDIRDAVAMKRVFDAFDPTVVIHMAAQALVRRSYGEPALTYATNLMGTVNVLDLARSNPGVRATVIVTTDKCYENREQIWPYRETDRLGGHDPYSNSKACAELAVAAYWTSYFHALPGQGLASVRAGNVIGGGDWSKDRLVPDMALAFTRSQTAILRRPDSVRPWQHVLEPLCGYFLAAERIADPRWADAELGVWNFGPDPTDNVTVAEVAARFARAWGDGARVESRPEPGAPHEARLLMLDASKARAELGWRPRWDLRTALEQTADWYRAFNDGEDMTSVTLGQIKLFGAMDRGQPMPAPEHNQLDAVH
jgi:CDP-glucose 4,6-dehydratase